MNSSSQQLLVPRWRVQKQKNLCISVYTQDFQTVKGKEQSYCSYTTAFILLGKV